MTARLFGCAGACLLTTACVGNLLSDTSIDPKSPIAAEAHKLSRSTGDLPKFSQIPKVPKDVRPVRQFGVAAAETVSVRDDLVRKTDPGTWTLTGGGATTAFAEKARADAGPEAAPADPGTTEAFARALRKRATPPPSPKR
jgi:hypothetical protein